MTRPHMIEDELAVRLPTHQILSTGITSEMRVWYLQNLDEQKAKAAAKSTEVKQNVEKMKHLQGILDDINNLTDDKNGLDISQSVELQEKLKVAKQMGANIPMHPDSTEENPRLKEVFTAEERDRLIDNLERKGKVFDTENKQLMQEMDVFKQESDRLMMLANTIQKQEHRTVQAMANNCAR